MKPIVYSFQFPKCEKCERWERIRPHAGICSYLMSEGLVYPDNVNGTENILEAIEGNVQLFTLDFFGCRVHTDLQEATQ